MSAWCWSLMTKTMAEMCCLAKANFSPSLLLSLLYAPFCFFTAVRSFSPVFFWFFCFVSISSLVLFLPLIFGLFVPCFFLVSSCSLSLFSCSRSLSPAFVIFSAYDALLFPCFLGFSMGSAPVLSSGFRSQKSHVFVCVLASFPPPLPLLCSAFYRAREHAETSSPVNQSMSGIVV